MGPITDPAQRARLQELVATYFALEDEGASLDAADQEAHEALERRQDALIAEMKAIRDPGGRLTGSLAPVGGDVADDGLRDGVARLTERWWAGVRERFERDA